MIEELSTQQVVYDNIKTIYTNYKKDGPSRKNTDYLAKRLVSLEAQWNDFNQRHQELMKVDDKDKQYFREGIYEKTKSMYEEIRQDILRLLAQPPSTSKSPSKLKSPAPSMPPPPPPTQGQLPIVTLPQQHPATELLELQSCHINALKRAMAKVDTTKVLEKWELEEHLHEIKAKWETIDKLNIKIELSLKGSDDNYNVTFTEIEKRYDELKRQINSKIYNHEYSREAVPKIEIPEFNGDYTSWFAFKDLFTDIIHNNHAIPKLQKITHLKTKLRGEAENIVQHLSVTGDNYDTCWAILNQRYNNRRQLITSHLNTLLNLTTTHRTSTELKKMHDVIVECLSGIQNAGIDTTNWDPIIIHLMTQKLDGSLYDDYFNQLRDSREPDSLKEFLSFLANKFSSLDTRDLQRPSTSYTNNRQNIVGTEYNGNGLQQHTTNNDRHRFNYKSYHVRELTCPLCKDKHALMRCNEFNDMNSYERNETVTKLKICQNCLFSHGYQNCNSDKTCKVCNLKHHTLLHNYSNLDNDIKQRSSAEICIKHHPIQRQYHKQPEHFRTTASTPITTSTSASQFFQLFHNNNSTVKIKNKTLPSSHHALHPVEKIIKGHIEGINNSLSQIKTEKELNIVSKYFSSSTLTTYQLMCNLRERIISQQLRQNEPVKQYIQIPI